MTEERDQALEALARAARRTLHVLSAPPSKLLAGVLAVEALPLLDAELPLVSFSPFAALDGTAEPPTSSSAQDKPGPRQQRESATLPALSPVGGRPAPVVSSSPTAEQPTVEIARGPEPPIFSFRRRGDRAAGGSQTRPRGLDDVSPPAAETALSGEQLQLKGADPTEPRAMPSQQHQAPHTHAGSRQMPPASEPARSPLEMLVDELLAPRARPVPPGERRSGGDGQAPAIAPAASRQAPIAGLPGEGGLSAASQLAPGANPPMHSTFDDARGSAPPGTLALPSGERAGFSPPASGLRRDGAEVGVEGIGADAGERLVDDTDVRQPWAGATIDAETLATLVNDVLVEQARRHGVRLI